MGLPAKISPALSARSRNERSSRSFPLYRPTGTMYDAATYTFRGWNDVCIFTSLADFPIVIETVTGDKGKGQTFLIILSPDRPNSREISLVTRRTVCYELQIAYCNDTIWSYR